MVLVKEMVIKGPARGYYQLAQRQWANPRFSGTTWRPENGSGIEKALAFLLGLKGPSPAPSRSPAIPCGPSWTRWFSGCIEMRPVANKDAPDHCQGCALVGYGQPTLPSSEHGRGGYSTAGEGGSRTKRDSRRPLGPEKPEWAQALTNG